MDFAACFEKSRHLLLEGALGERLRREYGLKIDGMAAMAPLIYEPKAREALAALWGEYCGIAQRYNLPFLATTPTRRANRERTAQAGYDEALLLDHIADEVLPQEQARAFHSWAADAFARAGAEFLYAGIMPAKSEAIGMAQAMEQTGLPYLISFMIRKDGRLIDGTPISQAIAAIDAATVRHPLCYMTNCVHPSVLRQALLQPENRGRPEMRRFLGIQANTSPLPPEELDGAQELFCSDPEELAAHMAALEQIQPFKIFGGCCGTDGSHMQAIAKKISGQ